MTISSLQNPRIKAAAKLRERRGRESQQRIIIDGTREILCAVQAGVKIAELYVCPELCVSDAALSTLIEVKKTDAEQIEVTAGVLGKLCYGERVEGLVVTAAMPQLELGDIELHENALVAVIEEIEKPGNLGAIVRTADAAGVSVAIAADPVIDLFNPNIIRASLGAVFVLPTVVATAEATLQWLRQHKVNVFAARVDGAVSYTDVDYRGRAAVVLGSEADGLTEKWSADDVVSISLPMHGSVDSLNVSATAAVLFYEARRQRDLYNGS